MKKYILNFLIGYLSWIVLWAQSDPMKGQDTLVLELERNEWLPESQKFKVDFPKINLSLPPKLPYQYVQDSFAHQPKMILPTLKVEGLQKPTLEKLYQGMVLLSFSSMLQPDLLLNFNQGRTTQLDWGVTADYQGLFKNYVPHAQRNRINFKLHGGWNNSNWSYRSQFNYHRLMFNYFGDSTYQTVSPIPDSIKSNFSFIDWVNQITFGNSQKGFYAEVPLNIIYYSDRWKNHEFHIKSSPHVSYTFQKYTIGFQGNIYSVNLKNEVQSHSRLLLEAIPYGLVNYNALNLKLGIHWAKVDSLNFLLPEIDLNYQIFPKNLQVFLGIKGEGTLNSLYEIKRLYPFIEPNFYQQSSITPWKIYAGGKLNVKKLSIQAQGYYKKVNNLLIIYGSFEDGWLQNRLVKQGYLTSLYDEASRIYGLDGVTHWNFDENGQILLEVNYQNWKLENYEFNFHQPNWRLKFEGKYILNKKIEFFSRISYISSLKLGYQGDHTVINQKGIFLADWRIGYFLRPNIQLFIGGNNLFNQKYFLLRDYQEIPFHVYAGLRLSF